MCGVEPNSQMSELKKYTVEWMLDEIGKIFTIYVSVFGRLKLMHWVCMCVGPYFCHCNVFLFSFFLVVARLSSIRLCACVGINLRMCMYVWADHFSLDRHLLSEWVSECYSSLSYFFLFLLLLFDFCCVLYMSNYFTFFLLSFRVHKTERESEKTLIICLC